MGAHGCSVVAPCALSAALMAAMAAPCALKGGFQYGRREPVHWSARSGLTYEPLCDEHRWKVFPDCTWREEQVVELLCPCGAIYGLSARYSRVSKGDRDWHDVKLQCGSVEGGVLRATWGGRSALDFASEAGGLNRTATGVCASDSAAVGLSVSRRRVKWGDRDTYDFALHCSSGQTVPLQLHGTPSRWSFGRTESARLSCAAGERLRGLRVYRAFQHDGDVDQYDFQIGCAADASDRTVTAEPARAAAAAVSSSAAAEEPPPPAAAATPGVVDQSAAAGEADAEETPANTTEAAEPPPAVEAAEAAEAAESVAAVDEPIAAADAT